MTGRNEEQQRETKTLAGFEMRQREVGGAIGGLLSGAVAIEAEDRLLGDAPEHRELVFGQRRAERRDRCGKT